MISRKYIPAYHQESLWKASKNFSQPVPLYLSAEMNICTVPGRDKIEDAKMMGQHAAHIDLNGHVGWTDRRTFCGPQRAWRTEWAGRRSELSIKYDVSNHQKEDHAHHGNQNFVHGTAGVQVLEQLLDQGGETRHDAGKRIMEIPLPIPEW